MLRSYLTSAVYYARIKTLSNIVEKSYIINNYSIIFNYN